MRSLLLRCLTVVQRELQEKRLLKTMILTGRHSLELRMEIEELEELERDILNEVAKG